MALVGNSIFAKTVAILIFIFHLQWGVVSAAPNAASLAALIPPPQVLLPPHREEGQSLDDIIYGGGGRTIVTTTAPSVFARNGNNNVNRGKSNSFKVEQTFIPPRPHASFSTATPSPSIVHGSSSGEEIKIPQTLKHRSLRKQYSKADLVAAANLLRPVGFDFSKVLILNPSNFANISRSDLSSSSSSVSRDDDNMLVPLYEHVMFPLPLLDTPVFNELKPFMEMLMREVGDKLGKAGVGASGADNKKVLVIVPKSMLRSAVAEQRRLHTTPSPPKPQSQFRTSAPFSKSVSNLNSFPNKNLGNAPSPKFIIVPKGNKRPTTTTTTTIRPKQVQFSDFPTTKRVEKVARLPSLPLKKLEKSPDLQVAATSNKLSQRLGGHTPVASKSSSSDADKRSYSFSKGGEKYSFSYSVKNDEFGDVKSHSESRDGDQVAGEYSMLEPDGYTRVVRYTVDSDRGFKASVKRIPPS